MSDANYIKIFICLLSLFFSPFLSLLSFSFLYVFLAFCHWLIKGVRKKFVASTLRCNRWHDPAESPTENRSHIQHIVFTFKPELTTPCSLRLLFWGSIFYIIKVSLNNDYLSISATIFWSKVWSLYSGFWLHLKT